MSKRRKPGHVFNADADLVLSQLDARVRARIPRSTPPWDRDHDHPYQRHLRPDVHDIKDVEVRFPEKTKPVAPGPSIAALGAWNSVAIFFNFVSGGASVPGYARTTPSDSRAFLDEGVDPMTPGISEFLRSYFRTLSYGHLEFGIDTVRDGSGRHRILSLPMPANGAMKWEELIRSAVTVAAEDIWRAAGAGTSGAVRLIPSIVLVQRYAASASAYFSGYDQVVGGVTYRVGDTTHIRFGLDTWSPTGRPDVRGRSWWGTLCHEFAHNFLEFWDLYGPQGCTGYWDLLGDNSPPGRMSEVSAVHKERIGWLTFKHVLQGPTLSSRTVSLRPYTTTGDAIKVVPDPVHTPWEYFVLEYRRSTGSEVWRPDGALPEAGLFITHVNSRFGRPAGTWLLREAPYWDPELADHSDSGATDWTGHLELAGAVFPQGSHNAFTPATMPNSNFYGGRQSGLWVSDIRRVGDSVRCQVRIAGSPRVGWEVSAADRGIAGRFSSASVTGGEEVLIRDDDHLALLGHHQATWQVRERHDGWLDGWNLGAGDRELAADLDGNGRDEVFIRSGNWAGVLAHIGGRLRAITVQHDWIGDWNLGMDNHELVGDFDGDGRDEILIRSPEWLGMLELRASRLALASIQHDWVDGWNLGPLDKEFVGRFSRPDRDEFVVRSAEWLGLMQWDDRRRGFRLAGIQHDRVDGWNLAAGDWHVVADVDGDGIDELVIRSNRWMGVLKWVGGAFRVQWMVRGSVPHHEGAADRQLQLSAGDRLYSGRFRFDRDAVLQRDTTGLTVLVWNGHGMHVRHHMATRLDGHWQLGEGDRFILGDFHRTGPDVVDAPAQTVIDGLDDVFIHNGWGTSMVGVNHGPVGAGDPESRWLDQMGLSWMQAGELMRE